MGKIISVYGAIDFYGGTATKPKVSKAELNPDPERNGRGKIVEEFGEERVRCKS